MDTQSEISQAPSALDSCIYSQLSKAKSTICDVRSRNPTSSLTQASDTLSMISTDSTGRKKSNMKKGPVPKLSGKEQCLICGDLASGFNYGVISCEGCKAFYRRSVTQNKTYKCRGDQNCNLFTTDKRKCQACRLRFCQQYGMTLKYKSTEEYRKNKEKIKFKQQYECAINEEKVNYLKTGSAKRQEERKRRNLVASVNQPQAGGVHHGPHAGSVGVSGGQQSSPELNAVTLASTQLLSNGKRTSAGLDLTQDPTKEALERLIDSKPNSTESLRMRQAILSNCSIESFSQAYSDEDLYSPKRFKPREDMISTSSSNASAPLVQATPTEREILRSQVISEKERNDFSRENLTQLALDQMKLLNGLKEKQIINHKISANISNISNAVDKSSIPSSITGQNMASVSSMSSSGISGPGSYGSLQSAGSSQGALSNPLSLRPETDSESGLEHFSDFSPHRDEQVFSNNSNGTSSSLLDPNHPLRSHKTSSSSNNLPIDLASVNLDNFSSLTANFTSQSPKPQLDLSQMTASSPNSLNLNDILAQTTGPASQNSLNSLTSNQSVESPVMAALRVASNSLNSNGGLEEGLDLNPGSMLDFNKLNIESGGSDSEGGIAVAAAQILQQRQSQRPQNFQQQQKELQKLATHVNEFAGEASNLHMQDTLNNASNINVNCNGIGNAVNPAITSNPHIKDLESNTSSSSSMVYVSIGSPDKMLDVKDKDEKDDSGLGSGSIRRQTSSMRSTKDSKETPSTFKLSNNYQNRLEKETLLHIREMKRNYYTFFFPTTTSPTIDMSTLCRNGTGTMKDILVMNRLIDIVNLMEFQFKSFIKFCLTVPRFRALSASDQEYLFMESAMPVILVRTSITYNRVGNNFISHSGNTYSKEDFLDCGLPVNEFSAMWKLIENFNSLCPHSNFSIEIASLVTLIVLFSPVNKKIKEIDTILQHREYYLEMCTDFCIANDATESLFQMMESIQQLEKLKVLHLRICDIFYGQLAGLSSTILNVYKTMAPISNKLFSPFGKDTSFKDLIDEVENQDSVAINNNIKEQIMGIVTAKMGLAGQDGMADPLAMLGL